MTAVLPDTPWRRILDDHACCLSLPDGIALLPVICQEGCLKWSAPAPFARPGFLAFWAS